MSRCAEQHVGRPVVPSRRETPSAVLCKSLNDFADIAEIARLKSFHEARVDALQL